MNAGSFIGLTADVGKRQSAQQDLRTMMSMLSLKKQTEQEEVVAEQEIQAQLDNVKQQASLLLDGDRLAISQKAKEFQKDIRDRLKAVGGSSRAFMKKGGVAELRNYRRRVLDSQEFQTFKNNKINMERILLIKEKKMGHLLNVQDLQNLNAYNSNGKGEITYTGLLNEVDIDSMAFEYGHQVTPEQVLASQNNKLAIIANFEADTGEQYTPTMNDDVLKGYIRYKGYGGVGKNQQLLAKRLSNAKAQKAKALRKTVGGAVTSGANSVKKMSFSDMDNFEKGFGTDQNIGVLNAAKNSKRISTPVNFFARVPNKSSDTTYALKGGATILDGRSGELMQSYLGENIIPNEKGEYTIDPRDMVNTFDAKGSELTDRGGIRGWENNYKPMEISFAYKGKDKDDKDMLIVEGYDKDKFSKELNLNLYGDQGSPSGNGTVVVRMHDGNNPDFDFYQEIDVNSVAHQKLFGNMMGDANELSDEVKEQQQEADGIKTASVQAKKAVEKINKESLDTSVVYFNKTKDSKLLNDNTQFDMIKKQFHTENGNRDNLTTSFYQALSQGDDSRIQNAMDLKFMKTSIDNFGLSEVILDEKISDEAFMQKFYDEDKKGNNDMAPYYNYQLWKNIYNKRLNLK